ncbi:MAG: hypothetical protein CMJ23_10860, partial [Phycisphaerae bacterium]|nr:hypothetical protein [Phycisphaerae bacterium]
MPRTLATLLICLGTTASTFGEENLLVNGSFEQGLQGWTVSGDVSLEAEGWDDSDSVLLRPSLGQTAELSQLVTGLQPRGRYTVAAR